MEHASFDLETAIIALQNWWYSSFVKTCDKCLESLLRVADHLIPSLVEHSSLFQRCTCPKIPFTDTFI